MNDFFTRLASRATAAVPALRPRIDYAQGKPDDPGERARSRHSVSAAARAVERPTSAPIEEAPRSLASQIEADPPSAALSAIVRQPEQPVVESEFLIAPAAPALLAPLPPPASHPTPAPSPLAVPEWHEVKTVAPDGLQSPENSSGKEKAAPFETVRAVVAPKRLGSKNGKTPRPAPVDVNERAGPRPDALAGHRSTEVPAGRRVTFERGEIRDARSNTKTKATLLRPSREDSSSAPVIHVTVGRIEIKAAGPTGPAPAVMPAPSAPAHVGLQDFLRRVAEGRQS